MTTESRRTEEGPACPDFIAGGGNALSYRNSSVMVSATALIPGAVRADSRPGGGGDDPMAMTLRLTPVQTAALRRRAVAEGTSMQDVAKRALEDYIRAHEPDVPISVLIDRELSRFALAVAELGRWRD